MNTFNVSGWLLKWILNATNIKNGLRGIMAGSSRKLLVQGKKHVQNHIVKLPKYQLEFGISFY